MLVCRSLLEHGYVLLHVRDEFVGSALLGKDFLGTLPALEEIVAENLEYDIEDARRVRVVCRSSKTRLTFIESTIHIRNRTIIYIWWQSSDMACCRSCKRGHWDAPLQRNYQTGGLCIGEAAISYRKTCTPKASAATLGTTPMFGLPPAGQASR
jgi:hypothetical protein